MRLSRDEKGQALPITIGILALVALLVAPFLNQASSGLIGARVYQQVTDARYAADAGVEHAIWNLNYGGLGDVLQNVGDGTSYLLDETLNGLTTTVTVTVEAVTGGQVTGGDITDVVIDKIQYGANGGEYNEMIQVGDGVYAVVYTDWSSDGWLMTASVAPDGSIGATPLDSWEYETSRGIWPDIVHVAGEVYAIVYRGPGNDGFLKTVRIAADGTITPAAVATLEFDNRRCIYPEIIHVAGDTYAIVYCGRGNDGFVKTVQIAADGSIGGPVIDSLEFDNRRGSEPSIINVLGDVYAIAYSGQRTDGFIKTVTIAPNGDIANTPIDSYEFNTDECQFPEIVNVFDDVYAVVYSGSSPANGTLSGGIVSTLAIAPDGTITQAVIDEMAFDVTDSEYCDVIRVAGDIFAVTYTNAGEQGVVSTLSIYSDGQLDSVIIDTLVYDTALGYYPRILPVTGGVFVIAHTGANWYGALTTVGIQTAVSGVSVDYRITATAGDSTDTALVNMEGGGITIYSWE